MALSLLFDQYDGLKSLVVCKLSLVTRKPVFGIFDQVRHKPAYTAKEAR